MAHDRDPALAEAPTTAAGPRYRDRLAKPFRVLRGWLRRLARVLEPGPAALAGMARVTHAVLVVLGGFIGLRLHTPLGTAADFLLGAGLAFLMARLGVRILQLLGGLARQLPRFLGRTGAGVLLALILLLALWGLPPKTGLAAALVVTLLTALLGAALGILLRLGEDGEPSSGRWGRWRRPVALAGAVVLALTAGGIVGWLLQRGSAEHLVPPDAVAAPGAAFPVTPLTAPDPADPGPHRVLTLTYGAGTDRYRPEYGEGVDLTTRTVDARPFTEGYGGWRAALRRWYWGFEPDAWPLNGRVWYPAGEGPFPLVLVVHGNHNMMEASDPGYAYLGEHLASRGFILVSVDENFLNGGPILGGIRRENDARGWLLLEHLRLWREWSSTPGHPFAGKVDLEAIALIGHSRGGEAVGHAAAFNRLSHYPDDATVDFDFGFALRGVVAIAPSDGQYRPAGRPTPVSGVSYLLLQGGHDSDVSLFLGERQWNRVRLPAGSEHFKASVHVYRANHGQFNTVWGDTDLGPPASWLLNREALLPGEDQRRVARVYITAFLEEVLRGPSLYRSFLRDHRAGAAWLPEGHYRTRYRDPSFRLLAGYEEDVDVTTATEEGVVLRGVGLATWREGDPRLRGGASRDDHAVWLGWRAPEGGAGRREVGDPSGSTSGDGAGAVPRYALTLPEGLPARWGIDSQARLAFSLAQANEDPGEEEAEGGEGAGEDEGARAEAPAGQGEDEGPGYRPPVDLTVELVDAAGRAVALPLSRFRPLLPPLPVRFTKLPMLDEERYESPTELLFQDFELPLSAFTEAAPGLDPGTLREIRLVFDRSPEGVVVLDDVGFTALAAVPEEEEIERARRF